MRRSRFSDEQITSRSHPVRPSQEAFLADLTHSPPAIPRLTFLPKYPIQSSTLGLPSSGGLEPAFALKFLDGALNGLDALAGRVGNRLTGRPRLPGVAVQMCGDEMERHGSRRVAQIPVPAQLLKPMQLHIPKWPRPAHACLHGHMATAQEGAENGGTATSLSA